MNALNGYKTYLVAAIAIAAAGVLANLGSLDPESAATIITTALLACGLRHGLSTEIGKAVAQTAHDYRKPTLNILFAAIMIGICFASTGCANPTHTSLTDDANVSQLDDKEQGRYRVDEKGNPSIDLATKTAPPTMFQTDKQGIWGGTTAQGAILNVPSFGQIWTPNDSSMDGVKIFGPEGQLVFSADRLTINASEQARVWAEQIGTVVESSTAKTQIEATRYIESLKASGEITADVAEILAQLWVPTFPESAD